MLRFQVGAIELNRGDAGGSTSYKRVVRACGGEAFSGRRVNRPCLLWLISLVSILILLNGAEAGSKGAKKKKRETATPTPNEESGQPNLTNIPLTVGHEAKGLVLPDFDSEGHMRGRFEAGTARRIDEEHVGFDNLKITTFTPENNTDLQIEMHTSVLNLKTRVLTSQERATIKRSDFNIVGDSVEFDTNTRTGKLVGNVKMVITDQSHFVKKEEE
jgi:hypothetical protein